MVVVVGSSPIAHPSRSTAGSSLSHAKEDDDRAIEPRDVLIGESPVRSRSVVRRTVVPVYAPRAATDQTSPRLHSEASQDAPSMNARPSTACSR
jgi:hypothetical protein